MRPSAIYTTIHKLGTIQQQLRHVKTEHPIYSRILELAKALSARDSASGVVPEELLPSHASFLAVLNVADAIQHHGLQLSKLDPLSRRKAVCFLINLDQMVVNNVSQTSEDIVDFPLPVGEDVQMELKNFIIEQVNDWKNDKQSRRQERKARLLQERERCKEDIIAFLRRLVELNLIGPEVLEGNSPASVCPLCSQGIVRCHICGAHACKNSTCQASSVISVVKCSTHGQEFFCGPCATDRSPAVVGQCPTCSEWRCIELFSECVGRPGGVAQWRCGYNRDPSDHSHSISQEDDSQLLNNTHPPRIAPCLECVREGYASAWRRCNNTRCWSRTHKLMEGMVCPDCAPGGRTCACSRTWVCEPCSADPPGTPFVQCPSCKAVYCRDWCAYTQACAVCSNIRPCDDCMEEEPEVDAKQLQLQSPLFTERCGRCRRHICNTCAPSVTRCSSCDHCYCVCEWTDIKFVCITCSAAMCQDCIQNWDECRQCIKAKYPSYRM